ncbi:hypothetical protein [Aeromicrobium sp. 179-A 4D2 NHS]|uniref:hypothetical protein n=1 Tax=Aeromicrobium sp. 179-A 4D2 NHS TaxID=3142375 RepID=UPI0039A32B66
MSASSTIVNIEFYDGQKHTAYEQVSMPRVPVAGEIITYKAHAYKVDEVEWAVSAGGWGTLEATPFLTVKKEQD